MTTIVQRATKGIAAALVAVSIVAVPAHAQPRHHDDGAGIAAGVIGGLAAGAILGGALQGQRRGVPVDDPDQFYAPGYEACGYAQQPLYDASGRLAAYRNVPTC